MNEGEILTLLNSEYKQCPTCKKVFHFQKSVKMNQDIGVASHYETCFLCDWGSVRPHEILLIKMHNLEISLEDIEQQLYNNLYKLHIENENHIVATKK